jgi:hypothetical protein
VQLRAGQIIGSTYHTVRVTGDLRKAGEPDERVTAVTSWRDAPYLTGAERTALELAEAALAPEPVRGPRRPQRVGQVVPPRLELGRQAPSATSTVSSATNQLTTPL